MAMTSPTAAEIRLWSLVDFNELGFTDDAKLQVYVDRAAAEVIDITGRVLGGLDTTDDPNLIPLVQLAIQIRTEMLVHQAQPDYVETLADFDLISGFSAGPYSETRRGVGDAVAAKVLSANPMLHDLLFNLLTEDKYDDYILFLSGQPIPALAFATLDMGDLSDYTRSSSFAQHGGLDLEP
jgi:hypothetical protein